MWLDEFIRMKKESGMSLDEISQKSGVPKGTLAKITSGVTKTPALETMRSLVYAMGYTLDDLEGKAPAENRQEPSKEAMHIAICYDSTDDHGRSLIDHVVDYIANVRAVPSNRSVLDASKESVTAVFANELDGSQTETVKSDRS